MRKWCIKYIHNENETEIKIINEEKLEKIRYFFINYHTFVN